MLDVKISDELVSGLCSVYGKALDAVILYGSVSRGDNKADSDVDIAVILNGDGTKFSDELYNFITDINLKYDRVFSVIDISVLHYRQWLDVIPFYKNIEREGIVLWKCA